MTDTAEPRTERTISLRDAGPIRSLNIVLPAKGGVVVLRGPNGSGKTTAINAIARALGGNEAVSKRDGAISGLVELDGIRLTLGKQVRATGESELVATSLAGGELLRLFVDPGLKDQAAADAARIKAGLGLARITATPEDFVQAVGGHEAMAAITTEADLQTSDPVDLAGRVKRAAELRARRHEVEGLKLSGEIDHRLKDNEGIDISQAADEAALAGDREAQIRALAGLEATAKERASLLERAARARAALDGQAGGQTLADAQKALELRTAALSATEGLVERLRAELAIAAQQLKDGLLAQQDAEGVVAALRQREAALDGWRQSVAAAEGVAPIADADLQAARHRVEEARQAEAAGATVRAARVRAHEVELLRASRDREAELAETYRKAAAAAEGVLSGLFARKGAAGLQVRDGRLVTEVPGRGEVYFAELSHGQRWRYAIGLGCAGCGPLGIIPLDQVGYEGLDYANRREVSEEACARGVTIITAEATDGVLRAEEDQP